MPALYRVMCVWSYSNNNLTHNFLFIRVKYHAIIAFQNHYATYKYEWCIAHEAHVN